MAIDLPISDTSRIKHSEPEQLWPESVKIQLKWLDKEGRPLLRTMEISANQFFGRGGYGAPLEGAAVISVIENMRRAGPPQVKRIKRNR